MPTDAAKPEDFFFTFGQCYRNSPHPQGGHPDGWFRIRAMDLGKADAAMYQPCGARWAFSYDAKRFEESKYLYPRGELQFIDATKLPDEKQSTN